jgi:hypothetical protein
MKKQFATFCQSARCKLKHPTTLDELYTGENILLHIVFISVFEAVVHLHLKGTHARDFIVRFFTFFWHHSIIDKAEAQNFKNFVKCYILVHNRIFANTALSPKNSASSLNTLYNAESAQFYSAFSQQLV